MSAQVRIATSAEYDLEAIADYISLDSPQSAGKFVRDVLEKCILLADMPERYPVVSGYRRPLRRVPFRGYSIYYLSDQALIEIVHVLHDSQDHRAILSN